MEAVLKRGLNWRPNRWEGSALWLLTTACSFLPSGVRCMGFFLLLELKMRFRLQEDANFYLQKATLAELSCCNTAGARGWLRALFLGSGRDAKPPDIHNAHPSAAGWGSSRTSFHAHFPASFPRWIRWNLAGTAPTAPRTLQHLHAASLWALTGLHRVLEQETWPRLKIQFSF